MEGGGSRFSMSNLRNAHVACRCRLFIPMSHVDFKKWPYSLSLYFFLLSRVSNLCVPCRVKEMPLSLFGFYPSLVSDNISLFIILLEELSVARNGSGVGL